MCNERYVTEAHNGGFHVFDTHTGEPCLGFWSLYELVVRRWARNLNNQYTAFRNDTQHLRNQS